MSDDSKMSLDEARELLDITGMTDEEELEKMFREKAKRAHPDGGGSEKEFHNIVAARDTLRDAMVRVRETSELVSANERVKNESLLIQVASQRHELAKAELEAIVDKGLRMYVSPLTGRRNARAILSAVFAVMTYLLNNFSTSTLGAEMLDSTDSAFLIAVMFIISVISGLSTAFLTLTISSTEETIKAFEEAFSDPSECARFLKQLLDARVGNQESHCSTFTQDELAKSIEQFEVEIPKQTLIDRLIVLLIKPAIGTGAMPFTITQMCKIVGEVEVVHILLIRAVEHGLVRRLPPDGKLEVRYELLTGDVSD